MSDLHFFNPHMAAKYGMAEAVFIQNLAFWIAHNKRNGKHQYEGRTWTYNSMKAFGEQFFYLSPKQVRRVLESLRKQGVVITGKFNKSKSDHTLWYAFVDEDEMLKGQIELPKKAKRNAHKGKSFIGTDRNQIETISSNSGNSENTYGPDETPHYVTANRAKLKPHTPPINFAALETTAAMTAALKDKLKQDIVGKVKDDPRIQRLGREKANGLMAWFAESKFDGEWPDDNALAKHLLNCIPHYLQTA